MARIDKLVYRRSMARRTRWLAVVLTVTAVGIAACGDDDGDEGGTTAGSDVETTSTAAAESDEPILIKTRIDIPTGDVLGGSTIGNSPFCRGGTFRDKRGTDDPSVPPYGFLDRTYRCPDGSLRMGFSPGVPQGRTQAGPWKIVSGTGAYKGLTGDGEMKITYDRGQGKNASKGRETFTGTVAR
jgi:hypothetical protein